MGSAPKTTPALSHHGLSSPPGAEARAVVLEELEKILESPHFRGSSRRKEFLSYVVHHSLLGEHHQLKERIIGTEVFHREADYATGEDPVVRVQAGEVRRRLEQYYHVAPPDLPVRIEIPIGSYAPVFHWIAATPAESGPAETPAPAATGVSDLPGAPSSPLLPGPADPGTLGTTAPTPPAAPRVSRWPWMLTTAALAMALALMIGRNAVRPEKPPAATPPASALEAFWSPAFKSAQPVIICLAKPVVYRPSLSLYQRYARTHPGTFESEPERDNEVLPLPASEHLTWGDMEIYPGYGVASGDTFAAVQISKLLLRMGKPSQVRIGKSYSFEDLRTSPAVVLGAFNNRWTMQMTANLHFTLSLDDGIREQGNPQRAWTSQYDPQRGYSADYGVVTRLLDGKSGQFLVSAAGIGSPGTQAAGELISNPEYLSQALRDAPPDWDKKNMQVIVLTNVIDSVPGPPRVVATYFW